MAKKIRPRGIRGPAKNVEIDRTQKVYVPGGRTGPEEAARLRAKRLAGGDERSARAHKAWATRRAHGGIGSGREKRTALRLTEKQKRYGRYRGHGNLALGVRICMEYTEKMMPMPSEKMIGSGIEETEAERLIRKQQGGSDADE